MRAALVSMPWLVHDQPSAANGNLKGYISKQNKDIDISSHSAHTTLWNRIPILYPRIAQVQWLGELLYAIGFFSSLDLSTSMATISKLLERHRKIFTINGLDGSSSFENFSEEGLYDLLQILKLHVDDTANDVCENDVVGLTTSTFQVFSSLALAERLKQLNPRIQCIFGGSGTALRSKSWFKLFNQVDYIVVGEGEKRFS